MTALETFRHEKDEFYKTDSQSPLTRSQKVDFRGLQYFPENPELALEAFEKPETIRMQTSTGDVQEYERFGQIHFTVDGQAAQLTFYRSDAGLFLPFVDALANQETYGAGRYLEPAELGDGRVAVDFNFAYNPYCAYNEHWSCPITPFENRLKVPIRAGEKIFTDPG